MESVGAIEKDRTLDDTISSSRRTGCAILFLDCSWDLSLYEKQLEVKPGYSGSDICWEEQRRTPSRDAGQSSIALNAIGC